MVNRRGTLTLVLMGLDLATGRAGRLSLFAVGKPPMAFLLSLLTGSCWRRGLTKSGFASGAEMDDDGEASDIKDLLLSSVGLEVGSQDLVSLGGDNLSLVLASAPVLGLLARLGAASDWAGVVFLTERLTMGTIESGILAAGKNIWTVSKKYLLGQVSAQLGGHSLSGPSPGAGSPQHVACGKNRQEGAGPGEQGQGMWEGKEEGGSEGRRGRYYECEAHGGYK